MPPVSEAQRRWAFANKDKPSPEGRAAADYAAADPGGRLPARAQAPKARRDRTPPSSRSIQSLVNRSPHR